MPSANRRTILIQLGSATTISLLAGCISDTSNSGSQSGKHEGCSFHVVVVADPPEDAEVNHVDDASEELGELFRRAESPETEFGTHEVGEREYDDFFYEAESSEAFEQISRVIEETPLYEGDDGPFGAYVVKDDLTLSVTLLCET